MIIIFLRIEVYLNKDHKFVREREREMGKREVEVASKKNDEKR